MEPIITFHLHGHPTRYCYCHFQVKNQGQWRSSDLPETTYLASGGAGIESEHLSDRNLLHSTNMVHHLPGVRLGARFWQQPQLELRERKLLMPMGAMRMTLEHLLPSPSPTAVGVLMAWDPGALSHSFHNDATQEESISPLGFHHECFLQWIKESKCPPRDALSWAS